MEMIAIPALACIAILLNELKLISQFVATPSGFVYLGTTHSSADYFYYLSQFTQGQVSTLWGQVLFTGEYVNSTLVGWTNILTGRIFWLLGIGPIPAYHISLILWLILLFITAYVFIRIMFPSSPQNRLVAFFLYAFANAFPYITHTAHGYTFSYYNFWFNKGIPFERFGQVPHQILAQISILWIFLCTVLWNRQPRIKHASTLLVVSSVCGFILAEINIIQWAFVLTVIFLTYLISVLIYEKPNTIQHHIASLSPAIGAGLVGLPMALYIRTTTLVQPYSNIVFWEKTYQNIVPFWQFVLGYGPVMPLACVGMGILLKQKSLAARITILYPLLSCILFFSPIPAKLGLMNDRFISQTMSLFLAILSTVTIVSIRSTKYQRLIKTGIVGIIILVSIPVYAVQIREQTRVDPHDPYVYLPRDVYDVYVTAKKVSSPKDIFLVELPYYLSFPALTGRRGFFGHPILTIENDRKIVIHNAFFYTDLSEENTRKLFSDNHINYVIGYTYTPNLKYPIFEKIAGTNAVGLYKILY